MSTIAMSYIPEALRYPGGYIEIDGSQAGLGGDLPIILLVGQKLASGSAAAGEIVRLSGVEDAKKKAGDGSMLHQMAARYRKIDPTYDMYILPYADLPAGVAATGKITVDAAATEAGVLALYIAQRSIVAPVAANATPADLATAIAAAINAAGSDIPVTAAAAAAVVTLTARHKGTCGNNVDIRLNLYGEETPDGLSVSLTAMSGGAGDPAPGDLAAIIGNGRWFRYVALGINDNVTIAAWNTESNRRYQPPVQQGFRIFNAYRGGFEDAATYGETKNAVHICSVGIDTQPMTTWETAAALCAGSGSRLQSNPVQSLEDTPLPGLVGVPGEYFQWTDANSLLFKGISMLEIGKDGTVYIKRLISMYQFRPDGSADDAFLDINTAEVMERIRYEQITGAKKKFTGTVAAKTDEDYRPGLRITTEDGVRAFLLSLYQNDLLRKKGWVQAYAYYKSTLVVEQDPDNPSRFNFHDTPVINSPYYIIAGKSSFLKAVPTY